MIAVAMLPINIFTDNNFEKKAIKQTNNIPGKKV